MNLLQLMLKSANISDNIEELKRLLTELRDKQEGGVTPAFIKRNVQFRIRGCPWGNLHGYIYENLTPDQLSYVYESSYEAGHPKHQIPSTSETDLFEYLEQNYGGSAEDLCKKIKAEIVEFTCVTFKKFIEQDRNVAYKVITLFYQLHRFRPKLNTLLFSSTKNRCNFEFRHSHPMLDAQSMENSALLSEILTKLSFIMPKEEQRQALEIDNILNKTQCFVADDFIGLYCANKVYLNASECFKLIMSRIQQWADSLPKLTNRQLTPRLDILLNLKIRTKIFTQRAISNELLQSIILQYPLNLNPYAIDSWKNKSESECLTYLTNSNKPLRIKPTLEEQAAYVEKIIVAHPLSDIPPSKALNMIIKALILHDSKLEIKIPSKITGINNIEHSPIAFLKKVVRARKNKENEANNMHPNCSPEALHNYWNSRVRFALIQQCKKVNEARLEFEHLSKIETKVCSLISDYVCENNIIACDQLYKLYVE